MKIIKITGIFLIVNLFISGFSIPAQAGVFDKFGVGARPISMGHTYIACGEGPETIFYNPAGLTLEKSPELSAMYANLYSLDLLNYYFLGLLYPGIAYGTIGLSMIYLGTSNNPSLASLDHSQNNILLSYAYRLSPYFNLGLNIKAFFVRSSKEAMGWGFDLGILSQISEFFRLGLMLNDFTDTEIKWAKETGIKGLSEDKIKRDLGIGAYFKPIKYILCVIDYSELLIDRASLHTGVEVFPVEHIVLRGGAFQQSGKYNWTLGLGINWKNWRFDYAFNDHFDLDATNIFSLSYRFVRKGENNP